MSAEFCCPVCAAELTIEQLFVNAETRQAFARLASISLPMGVKLLMYVGLFAPAKNRMAVARKVKLIEELLPDVLRGAIERKGREWQVSHDDWREAIDRMLAARDARKLSLPLTGHNYLYEILVDMADKAEAIDERTQERQRLERAKRGGSAGPVSAGDLVATAPVIATAPPASPGTSPLVRRMKADAAARAGEPSTTEEDPQP